VNTISEIAAIQNSRRPALNHKALCSHPQTPAARKACKEAYWAAQQAPAATPEPVALTATYKGLVGWTSARGKEQRGHIVADKGAGRLVVQTATGRLVQVAFTSLRAV
jgi:hypothetical protein